MDPRLNAGVAPYCLATEMGATSLERFWVVLLSNGMEVYQTENDPNLNEPSAWLRLKLFCKDFNLKIMGMAYANKSLDASTQINLPNNATGYFYSKRVFHMLAANPAFAGVSGESVGVGFLKDDQIVVHWMNLKNQQISIEERPARNQKHNKEPLALICN